MHCHTSLNPLTIIESGKGKEKRSIDKMSSLLPHNQPRGGLQQQTLILFAAVVPINDVRFPLTVRL